MLFTSSSHEPVAKTSGCCNAAAETGLHRVLLIFCDTYFALIQSISIHPTRALISFKLGDIFPAHISDKPRPSPEIWLVTSLCARENNQSGQEGGTLLSNPRSAGVRLSNKFYASAHYGGSTRAKMCGSKNNKNRKGLKSYEHLWMISNRRSPCTTEWNLATNMRWSTVKMVK